MAEGWWRLRKGAHPHRGRSRHACVSHGWLALLFERACLPFVVVDAELRFADVELLQPRQLRADIPSKTCEGG